MVCFFSVPQAISNHVTMMPQQGYFNASVVQSLIDPYLAMGQGGQSPPQILSDFFGAELVITT